MLTIKSLGLAVVALIALAGAPSLGTAQDALMEKVVFKQTRIESAPQQYLWRIASCRGTRPTSCHTCRCENFTVSGPNKTNCHTETICSWVRNAAC
jgi:hypothetical protein